MRKKGKEDEKIFRGFASKEKGIANLRKTFNEVKSIPCVERKIQVEEKHVTADDGYEIPVRIYHSETPKENGVIIFMAVVSLEDIQELWRNLSKSLLQKQIFVLFP